jgi:hypothetical protein
MIALLKYGIGVPFNPLERLQGQLGMPLPAPTEWELLTAAAIPFRLALEELMRQAAQGHVMHNDDTSMRILRLIRDPGDKRAGIFTNGIVSLVGTWTIALFFTGWKHAGENIAEVLKQRAHDLPAPIQMCDALSRNTPKRVETLISKLPRAWKTTSAGGRGSLSGKMPVCAGDIGRGLSQRCRVASMGSSSEDRLHFHQERSGPLMEGLHEWMEAQLAEHKTEPNSGLGKATSYFLNHWLKLTLFLRQAGSPIDNNIVERALKKAILNRRNALFYKMLNGAGVGDLCELAIVYESDSYLRVERSQSVRFSDRATAARRRARTEAF